jgi:hypothetical protein
MSDQNNNQTPHSSTSDSYDAHMIPAETAARKDRESDSYKQVPENAESSGSIDTMGGYTIDKEGLVNNYASEPEIYSETPGDLPDQSSSQATKHKYTIVDTFPSPVAAESIALEMKEAGLDTQKISIIGKNYQNAEYANGSLNWKDISQAGGLAVVLTELGISKNEALKYEAETQAGKLVVLVTGSNEEISQVHQILHKIGHRISEVSPS